MRILRLAHSIIREKLKLLTRSPKWAGVRDAYLKLHSQCMACGGKKHLQVHHIRPFHLDAKLELDPSNLVTLCMSRSECHLDIGHGGDFKAYNPDVLEHAGEFHDADARLRLKIEAAARALRRRD